MGTVPAAVDPTPASAIVRFGGVGPSVQRGPSRRPQPFQRPSATVLDYVSDALGGGAISRTGIDPDECAIDYNFSNCDDSDFENI